MLITLVFLLRKMQCIAVLATALVALQPQFAATNEIVEATTAVYAGLRACQREKNGADREKTHPPGDMPPA